MYWVWVIVSFMNLKTATYLRKIKIHIVKESVLSCTYLLIPVYGVCTSHVSGWCLKEGFIWPENLQLCLHNCCYQSHSQSVNQFWHCLRQGGKWSGVIHSAVSVSQSVDCTHQKTHTNVCGIIHEEWQLESFIDWTLLTLSGITLY